MPGFQDFVLPFGGGTSAAYAGQAAPAYAQMFGAYPQALSGLYGSASNAFTGYGQALSGQSGAQANNYGSYAGGLGNIANAYANQASARYGANAMAEAARQGAAGNIGSAALGAYGNIGGQALQAWAANQQSYNNALSQMHGANQYSASQLGQSQNAALAGLGNAYAGAAGSLAPSTVASNIAFNFSDAGGGGFGGGGFGAYGPDGTIGTGSYGGGGGAGGGMNFTGSRTNNPGNLQPLVDRTYGGIDAAREAVASGRSFQDLLNNGNAGLDRLDAQHYSSREMPGQMMQQGLSGLMALGDQAYGNSNAGMDQFYRNQQASDSSRQLNSLARQMGSGYYDSSNRIGQNSSALSGAWRDNRAQYDASLQNLGNMYGDAQSSGPNSLRSQLADALTRGARVAAVYPGMRSPSGRPTGDNVDLRQAEILQSLIDRYYPSGTNSAVMPKYV